MWYCKAPATLYCAIVCLFSATCGTVRATERHHSEMRGVFCFGERNLEDIQDAKQCLHQHFENTKGR